MGTSPDRATPSDRQSPGIEAQGLSIIGQLGGGLLAEFARVVADVINGLIDAAVNLGGTVIGVVTDVVDAVVNLVKNLAGAILGGGSRAAAAGLPDSFEPGELADIADGQRELLDRFDLLEDNAGHAQATMSRNIRASAAANMNFNTLIAPPKNVILTDRWQNIKGGPILPQWGFVFQAPGVWQIDLLGAIDPKSSSARGFYVELTAHRVIEYLSPGGTIWYWHPDEYAEGKAFSVSRFEVPTHSTRIQSFSFKKPIVADVFRDGDGMLNTLYVTASLVSAGGGEFELRGGTRFSSFSVDRLSADTTDYGAPEDATGTDYV